MLLLQRFPLRITTDIKAAGTDDDFRGPVCPICAAVLNTFRRKKKREDQWRLVFSHTAYIHLSLWCLFAAAAVNICAEVWWCTKRDKSRSCVCSYLCLCALIWLKCHLVAVTGGTGDYRLVPPNLFSGIVVSPSLAVHTELLSHKLDWPKRYVGSIIVFV